MWSGITHKKRGEEFRDNEKGARVLNLLQEDGRPNIVRFGSNLT